MTKNTLFLFIVLAKISLAKSGCIFTVCTNNPRIFRAQFAPACVYACMVWQVHWDIHVCVCVRARDQNGCETAGMEMIFLIDWRRSGGFRRISLCAATYLLLAIRAYRDFAPPRCPCSSSSSSSRSVDIYVKKSALSLSLSLCSIKLYCRCKYANLIYLCASGRAPPPSNKEDNFSLLANGFICMLENESLPKRE